MKNFKSIVLAAIIFVSVNLAAQAATEKIAVFPVDMPVQYSSFSIYPKTLTLISNDIINNLNLASSSRAMDLMEVQAIIDGYHLQKVYKSVLDRYKNTYTLDPNGCAYLAKKLGVTKILFVSGGFDTQASFLKKAKRGIFAFPGVMDIKPSYKLIVNVLLIDAQSGLRIMENTYNEDFEIKNFGTASQAFGENVTSIDKIKAYSDLISPVIAKNIGTVIAGKSTSVDAQIINQVQEIKPAPKVEATPSKDYIINNRKSDYKKTMIKKLGATGK